MTFATSPWFPLDAEQPNGETCVNPKTLRVASDKVALVIGENGDATDWAFDIKRRSLGTRGGSGDL